MSLMSWLRSKLIPLTPAEQPKAAPRGRNDVCWCGSGKKYKKCHLPTDEAKQREEGFAAQAAARSRAASGIVPGEAKKAPRPQENKPFTGGR